MKDCRLLFISCFLGVVGFCFINRVEPSAIGQGIDVHAMAFDTDIEPSAVEPIGDGKLLLIANDKDQSLLVVNSQTRT